VKVSWKLSQDTVEVAVSDGGGPTVPVVNEPSNWSLGGRGLGIVARLSMRWGVCAGAGQRDSDHSESAGDPDDHAAAAHDDDTAAADGECPGCAAAGETTVWAELPVRYGRPASLVIASSRDA